MSFTVRHTDVRVLKVPDDDTRALLDAWAKTLADWPDDGTTVDLAGWELLPDLPERGDAYIERSGRNGRYLIRSADDNEVRFQSHDHSTPEQSMSTERFFVRFIKA